MDLKHTLNDVIEMLWDLLQDPVATQGFIHDPSATVTMLGMPGVSGAEIHHAMPFVMDRLPPTAAAQAPAVVDAALSMPPLEESIGRSASTNHSSDAGDDHADAVHPAPRQAVQKSSDTQPPHRSDPDPAPHEVAEPELTPAHLVEPPVTSTIVNNTIVNNTYVTNDNRVITEIEAGDDVVFDQDIDNNNVTAINGGVAVGDDVEDSVVNTGTNTGVIAGDDADLNDSVVGNGNTQINDSEVGAFAEDGDATAIDADGNVNTGSGDLVDVETEGDAQVVTGNGNEVSRRRRCQRRERGRPRQRRRRRPERPGGGRGQLDRHRGLQQHRQLGRRLGEHPRRGLGQRHR